MKTRLMTILLVLAAATAGTAQELLPDTLLFVFKLHGQTRRYEMTFSPRNDSIVLNWRIMRNLHWQKGSFTMTPEAVRNASMLSFLMPEDRHHVTLPDDRTAYILSQEAYRTLKAKQHFEYNHTRYGLKDSNETAAGFSLLHVYDKSEGGEMWILDNPVMPIVWKMQNNPLEINWSVK